MSSDFKINPKVIDSVVNSPTNQKKEQILSSISNNHATFKAIFKSIYLACSAGFRNFKYVFPLALLEYSQKTPLTHDENLKEFFPERISQKSYIPPNSSETSLGIDGTHAKYRIYDTGLKKIYVLDLDQVKESKEIDLIVKDPNFKNITSIEFNTCNFDEKGWELITRNLPKTIEHITFSNSYIDPVSGEKFGKNLASLSSLKSVSLSPPIFDTLQHKTSEENQEGLRNVWYGLGDSDLKSLESLVIRPKMCTGSKEWALTASILFKCIKNNHILNWSDIGWEGELNTFQVKSWAYSAMLVHSKLMINSLSDKELKGLPDDSWSSYEILIQNINKKKHIEINEETEVENLIQ